MIKELIKLANHLDKKGFMKEADYLDKIIAYADNVYEVEFDKPMVIKGSKPAKLDVAYDSYKDELSKIISELKKYYGNDWVGEDKSYISGGYLGKYHTGYEDKIRFNLNRSVDDKDVNFLNKIQNMLRNSVKGKDYVHQSFLEYEGKNLDITTIYKNLISIQGEKRYDSEGNLVGITK